MKNMLFSPDATIKKRTDVSCRTTRRQFARNKTERERNYNEQPNCCHFRYSSLGNLARCAYAALSRRIATRNGLLALSKSKLMPKRHVLLEQEHLGKNDGPVQACTGW